MKPCPKAIEDDPSARDLWLCDVCACGDYRGDHRGLRHNGSCTKAATMSHGFEPCHRFHLHKAATDLPLEAVREHVFARFKRIGARG